MYRRICRVFACLLVWLMCLASPVCMAQQIVPDYRCGAAPSDWQSLPEAGLLVARGQACWLRIGPALAAGQQPGYVVLQYSPMLRMTPEPAMPASALALEQGWRILLPQPAPLAAPLTLRLDAANRAFSERVILRGSGDLPTLLQAQQHDLMTTLLAATLLLTSAAFTAAFGFAVREWLFGAYAAYAISLGLSLLGYRRFDLLLFGSDWYWLWQVMTPLSTCLLCWVAPHFGRFHQRSVWVVRALYLIIALDAALLLWSLLGLAGLPLPSLAAMPLSRFQFENYQDMVVEFLIMLGGWLVWRAGAAERRDGLLLALCLIPSMFIDLVNQLWDPWLAPWLQAHWGVALSPAQNAALHFNGALTWLTLPAIFCLALARRAWQLHSNLVSERNQLEVRVAQRTRELSSANQELAFQASTDALTGLLNRRRMMSQIEHEVERARRYKLPLSLCMIDIDHFKRVNDSHGHLTGDRALVAVAGLLSASLRDSDQIARFGGEEFVLLLPETDAALAQGLVERLRLAVADLQLHADEGLAFSLTISGGITELDAADPCDDAGRMLMRADQALYGAKSGGRNCVRVAHLAA